MRADAPEFVVQHVKVFAQQPQDFDAKLSVLFQERKKFFTRGVHRRGPAPSNRCNPVPFPTHGFAQAEQGSRTHHFEQLSLPLSGR